MKLIMENWKKFLTEGAGGTRGANKTNYLKKYEQALYAYYLIVYGNDRVSDVNKAEERVKSAKKEYLMNVPASERREETKDIDNRVATEVRADIESQGAFY
tara:strand:+ start:1476 stop:1778 length:303 start_codon:yes stop_codon:yes gene_type:complete